MQRYNHADQFSQALIGHADCRGFGYALVRVKGVLDILRCDLSSISIASRQVCTTVLADQTTRPIKRGCDLRSRLL